MNVYTVRVFQQGLQKGGPFRLEAPSAEAAMNEVEARLGLDTPTTVWDTRTKSWGCSNWHGYEFRARRLV